MPMSSYRVAVTVCAAALTLSACAYAPQQDERQSFSDAADMVRLYGTDGTMQNVFSEQLADPTLIAGMKGTRPMTPLPADFVNRLREVDPSLNDFLFAGETYDAVVISALAAELAGTPDPEVVRGYIRGVTVGGEQCRAVADCLDLARAGRDLEYRGVSLNRAGFTDRGEPAATTYETLHFGRDGVIDPGRSEFIGAGDLSMTSSQDQPEPRPRLDLPPWEVEPLVFGGLLPQTGDLAGAYPPIIAGAMLAVEEINAAGGVFGVEVEWIDGDDGTDQVDVARATLESHVEEGAHIIIGPAASGLAKELIPDAAAAKRILFSPSNTAADLVEIENDGYYFRTAPPDTMQGAALADILLRDGIERVVIVARDDAYGTGLQRNTNEALARFGVAAAAVTMLTYDPPEAAGQGEDQPATIPSLDRLVERIIDAEPDGVVVVGYEEAAQIVQRLVDAGMDLGR